MNKTVRSCLTGGVSVLTAVSIAFVPSVAAPAPHPTAAPLATVRVVSMPIELTALVQQQSTPVTVPTLLRDWLERIVVPPSANAPAPTTPDGPPVVTPTDIEGTVRNIYYAIEPWVAYGFEWVAYAVGWVPYVGWLSPQVMIFYRLGESIVRSITFNIADWLGNSISFWTGLGNVGRDTVDAFIRFGGEQWDFWLPNIPRPPGFPRSLAALTVQEAVPGPLGKLAAGPLGKLADGPLGKLADVLAPAKAEVPAIQNPEPITQKVREGRLAKFVQKITERGTSAGRASFDIRALGTLGQEQGTAGEQPRPRAHGLVTRVSSAVRDAVSSAPHPVRDHLAAAKAKAKDE